MPKIVVENKKVNALSILSLIFGILFFIPFGPIIAIVTGFIALSQIKQTGEQGSGMAIAGIIIGFFWILMLILIIILVILLIESLLLMYVPLVQ